MTPGFVLCLCFMETRHFASRLQITLFHRYGMTKESGSDNAFFLECRIGFCLGL